MSLLFVATSRLSAAIVVAGLALAATPANAQVVGTTSAVNPTSTSAGRTLTLGAQIIHDDRIRTDAKASLQLLFIDRTSMSIGPNSDVIIDDYVFDTKANAGKLTVSLGKGLLRFIGGQITHSGEANIKTPSALIGIRGGAAQVSVGSQGTQAVFLGGNSPGAGITVTPIAMAGSGAAGSSGRPVTITTPGYGTTVSNAGVSNAGNGALQQAPVPASTLAPQNSQLTSSPGAGQSGGAPAAITTQVSALSNIAPDPTTAITVSSASTSPSASSSKSSSSSATGGATGTSSDQTLTTTTMAAQQSTQTTAAAATFSQSFGPAAFSLTITRCCDPNNQTSPAPFLPVQFAPAGNTFISNVLGYRNASSTDASVPAPGAILQYGINITGTGAAQSSWFYVATGAFIDNGSGGLVEQGGFNGSMRAAAKAGVFEANGSLSSPFGAVTTDSNRLPNSVTINQVHYDTTTGQYGPGNPNNPNVTEYNIGAGNQSYTYTQTEQATAVPPGLGSNRPSVTLNGYVGGIMRTRDVTNGINIGAPFIISNANNSPGDVTIQLDSTTSRLQANFNISRQSGVALANIFNTASYQFGSTDPTLQARSTYVDYDNFGARNASSNANSPTGNDTLSTVNGAALDSANLAMVAVKPADAQAIFGGIGNNTQFCQCEFTRWGFWSAQSNRPPVTADFRDNGNLMLWVAGQLPSSSAAVPTTGIATYVGHVVANILNAGNQYVDAGNFKNVVNFATGVGAVTVGGPGIGPGIDGSIYAGTINFLADRRNFSGILPGTVAGRNMDMTGSFFKGTAGAVGEMGGRVNITGPGGYVGSGVFVGKQ
jgi:hypothetical protein